jgi:hypothetical protein
MIKLEIYSKPVNVELKNIFINVEFTSGTPSKFPFKIFSTDSTYLSIEHISIWKKFALFFRVKTNNIRAV